MNIETKEIYSEVYQVLNLLGNEYIDKLPSSLFRMVKEKRDSNYVPQYREEIPLNKQNIKKETLAIIALLYLNYWCENEKEKLEIKQILNKNEHNHTTERAKKKVKCRSGCCQCIGNCQMSARLLSVHGKPSK